MGAAEASQQALHRNVGGSLTQPTWIWGTCHSLLGPCLPQAPCTTNRTQGSGQCCKQYINGSFLLLILQGGSPETHNPTYSLMKALQQGSQPILLLRWKLSPWSFKLIWDVEEGVTLLLRQSDPLLFKPFLFLSPWATAWEMEVGIIASWTCHDLHGITPAQTYVQAFENICPSPKVVNRPPRCWKVHKLPRLFLHKTVLF